MKNVFDFTDYKKFLKHYLSHQPRKGHGLKTVWAEKIGCNLAYLSRVLNKDAELSVEQALELSENLNFDKEEEHFFMLLVRKERAGSHKLKARIQSEINSILQKRSFLKNRVEVKTKITAEIQAKFYSSWLYSASHMALTLPIVNTKKDLAEHFHIPIQRASEILEFLEQINLISVKNDEVKVLENKMFLGSDSDLISKHHTNWRIKALEELGHISPNSIHYSTVYTFSKSDFPKVKEAILKAIEEVRSIVRDTKAEEEMTCFNIDFFRL